MKREDDLDIIDLEAEDIDLETGDRSRNKENTGPVSPRGTSEEDEKNYWEHGQPITGKDSKEKTATGRRNGPGRGAAGGKGAGQGRETADGKRNGQGREDAGEKGNGPDKDNAARKGAVLDEETVPDMGTDPEGRFRLSPVNSRGMGNILLLVGILCLLAGGGIFLKSFLDSERNKAEMEALREQQGETGMIPVSGEQESGSQLTGSETDSGLGAETGNAEMTESTAQGSETTLPEYTSPVLVPNPYKDAFLQNQDMAGWIKIEGTKIDYPVMQTMEDENYYLERGFDKKSNKNGCLILDTDSSITEPVSTNQIIHGHNMKSGEMFGTLTDYEKQDYFKEHPVISLFTKECERRYEVIAVFRSQVFRKTDEVFKFYKFFQADTEEEFNNFYNNIKSMSLYDTNVTASFGDKFLTLSTCVYHVENGRFVVVAREMEPGESYEPVNPGEPVEAGNSAE